MTEPKFEWKLTCAVINTNKFLKAYRIYGKK